MKMPSKGFLFAIGCIILILCTLPFIQGVENPKSKYINGVLIIFFDFKEKTAAHYRSNVEKKVLAADYLRAEWNESARGQGYGVKSVVFGAAGEVVVISEQFDIVVLLTPNPKSSTGWSCQTYPRVSGSTLCSKEN